MEKIQDSVKKLNAMRKAIQVYVIVFLVILCAVTAIAFNHPTAGAVAALAAALYYFGFFRVRTKQYQKEFVHQTLIWSACKDCTDVVYDCNKKLESTLHSCPLFPIEEKSVISLWQGFTAECRKHHIAANEMSCNFLINTSRKGLQTKCLTGTVVSMDVTEEYASMGDVIIYDRSILYQHIQKIMDKGYKEAENLPEGIDTERFIVLVPQQAEPVFTEKFVQRFSTLASKTEKPFAIRVNEGNMIAFLAERFYAQKISVKYEITEAALIGNRLPELQSLVSFAG